MTETSCPCCHAELEAVVTDLGGDPLRGHSYEVELCPCTDAEARPLVDKPAGTAQYIYPCPRCWTHYATMGEAEGCCGG